MQHRSVANLASNYASCVLACSSFLRSAEKKCRLFRECLFSKINLRWEHQRVEEQYCWGCHGTLRNAKKIPLNSAWSEGIVVLVVQSTKFQAHSVAQILLANLRQAHDVVDDHDKQRKRAKVSREDVSKTASPRIQDAEPTREVVTDLEIGCCV